MYASFDPTQRAQGIPPVREEAIESWLDAVLAGPSVLAWHGDRVVGHVMFVPDGEGSHELAIFVHQTYQEAGVGSALLSAGLDHARDGGATSVWLSVSGGNTRARRLYRRTGFSRDDATGGALRLSRRL
jgi:ribosomal protein S18 acetylase RimI-like enzyme